MFTAISSRHKTCTPNINNVINCKITHGAASYMYTLNKKNFNDMLEFFLYVLCHKKQCCDSLLELSNSDFQMRGQIIFFMVKTSFEAPLRVKYKNMF